MNKELEWYLEYIEYEKLEREGRPVTDYGKKPYNKKKKGKQQKNTRQMKLF